MVLFINYIEFPLVIYSWSFISHCQACNQLHPIFQYQKKNLIKCSHNALGTFVTEQMSPSLETISCTLYNRIQMTISSIRFKTGCSARSCKTHEKPRTTEWIMEPHKHKHFLRLSAVSCILPFHVGLE